mgnify:CR=1 FL=1
MVIKKLGIDIQPKDVLWTPVGVRMYIVDHVLPSFTFQRHGSEEKIKARKAVSGNTSFIIEDKEYYEVFVP